MIITISGKAGSGKSTIAKLLATQLNYDYYDIGGIRRNIAKQMNLPIEKLNNLSEKQKEFDTSVDEFQKQLRGDFVLDSRLGFYFHPESVKIFISVDDSIAAKRIFHANRKTEIFNSELEAFNHIKQRNYDDDIRFKKLYGVSFLDLKNYDLILDSSIYTPNFLCDQIVKFLNEFYFQNKV